MQGKSRGCCKCIVQILLACITTILAQTDVIEYGTRLRPLTRYPHQPAQPNPCLTCNKPFGRPEKTRREDKSQQSSNDNEMVHKTNSLKSFYSPKPQQQTSLPTYSEFEKENPKRPATFFFTQVEPHRFEYRAMFQHNKDLQKNVFQPFVHDFDAFSKDFPPLPKFPSFPEFFNEHKPIFPNFHEFSFPTLPPDIKREWSPVVELQRPDPPSIEENLEVPLPKTYDVLLEHTNFPKIFRFNEERINIEDFDREKKLRFFELGKKQQNELLEHENVKRDHLLILHGGIFTVQEPPLFNKQMKKRKPHKFHSRRLRLYKNANI